MANDKRGRKPDWNKRNFIIGAVVAVLTALGVIMSLVASHEPGNITQNIQGGVGNITQNIQGGIRNTTQTINNILNPTPPQAITIVPSTSPPVAIAGPAVEGLGRLNSDAALPQTANTALVTDDPYRHKATSSVDSASEIIGNFSTGQDRDDYALGLEHIAHSHQRLGGFTIHQVIAEGRAVRKQAEAAREAERQRIERLANAKRAEDEARRQEAMNAANAAQLEAQRRDAINSANERLAEEAAEKSRFANSYAGAMHDVAAQNGPPCHIARSDMPGGQMVIWSYQPAGSSVCGSETYAFLNGSLISHDQY